MQKLTHNVQSVSSVEFALREFYARTPRAASTTGRIATNQPTAFAQHTLASPMQH